MKIKTILFILCLLGTATGMFAQDAGKTLIPADKFSIGMGIGQDYGGFGGHAVVYPARSIGLFAGFGYDLIGFGYNVGAKFRLLPSKTGKKVTPYAIVMYGYNAVIKVQDASNLSKAFYGPSAGIGIDLKPHARSKVYYSFGLTIPFRGSEVDDYIEDLKNNHGVVFENDLIPVTFSIGFKYIVN